MQLVTDAIEARIYAAIAEKSRELRCFPLAIGGTPDHAHLLVRFHTTTAVATLAQEVKGASSHLVTHVITPDQFFKWQGAYGAFTLRKDEVASVRRYVERQKEHHAHDDLWVAWEQTATEQEESTGG